MPTIFFYGPRMELEKKRELVRAFTEKASALTGIDPSAFVVYVQEGDADNVAVGGQLLRDRME